MDTEKTDNVRESGYDSVSMNAPEALHVALTRHRIHRVHLRLLLTFPAFSFPYRLSP